MTNVRALAPVDEQAPVIDIQTLHALVVDGDLSKLNQNQQIDYYRSVCEATGTDYRTRPFAFIRLNGKLVLYALRECAEQLRRNHRVSTEIIGREVIGDVYVVTAKAAMPDGRTDASTGAVAITGLKGEALANAYMKAETKAKRRVTLSICGLGMLDESEAVDVPGAVRVAMNEHGAPAIESHGESGPATLTPDQERDCRAYVRKHGYSGDDMRWWMMHHDMSLWSEMTIETARAMMADAKAGRRPWLPEPPASDEPPIGAPSGDLIGDDFDAEETGL